MTMADDKENYLILGMVGGTSSHTITPIGIILNSGKAVEHEGPFIYLVLFVCCARAACIPYINYWFSGPHITD